MKLQALSEKLTAYEKLLANLKRDAMADGHIDWCESMQIKAVESVIKDLKTSLTKKGSSGDGKLKFEQAAIKVNGAAFIPAVKETASKIGVDPNWLMAIMYSESGFKPSIVNPHGGATGLIQFMPDTALKLGTSTKALAAMNGVQQLKWVEKYFKSFGSTMKQIKNPVDLYLLNFYPIAVGKPDDYILGSHDGSASTVYKYNSALDHDKDGKISVGDFKHHIMTSKRLDGLFDDNGEVPQTNTPSGPTPTTPTTANTNLQGSVGANGRNAPADVVLVQKTLNAVHSAGLTADGACGPLTINAIKAYQSQVVFGGWSDGLIDPGGTTAKALFKGGTGGVTKEDDNPFYTDEEEEKNTGGVTGLFKKVEDFFTDEDQNQALGVGAESSDYYDNQIDNKAVYNVKRTVAGHSQCNVTSLSMTLINLANGNKSKVLKMAQQILKKKGIPFPQNAELPYLLNSIISAFGYSISGGSWVLKVAGDLFKDLVGKIETFEVQHGIRSEAFYQNKLIPALEQGAEVVLGSLQTNAGHISSLLGVRKDGIVVNDPYGAWMGNRKLPTCYLGNGKGNDYTVGGYKAIQASLATYMPIIERRLSLNGHTQKALQVMKSGGLLPANMGEKNFYNWADVTSVSMLWVQVYHKK